MSNTDGTLRDELVDDKVSDEGIATNMYEEKAKEVEPQDADKVAPKAKPLPKTKAGLIKAAYDKMDKMKKDDLAKAVEKMMYEAKKEEVEDDEEDHEDGDSEMSKTSEMKYKKEKKHKKEYKEDIQALVDSEATLSEGFKEKAEVIFEAAINNRISEKVEELEEQYTEELAEETDRIQSELVEKVDEYLSYVVENWAKENELAIENGLRAEIAESFMGALKNVFTEHYVEVPESKTDIVDELANKVDSLEEELNNSVRNSLSLREKVESLTRDKIVAEASGDLSAVQSEKLRKLVSNVDFENEEIFEEKVDTIKESYFGVNDNSNSSRNILEDTSIDADIPEEREENLAGPMAQYVKALRSTQ